MVFTLKERIFIVRTYFRNNKSVQSVQNQFEREFPDSAKPTKMSVLRFVRKFEEYGTVQNLPHVREKTTLMPAMLATMSEKLTTGLSRL